MPDELQPFPASFDSTTKVITAAVAILLLGATSAAGSAIAAGFGAAILIFSYAYSPRGYAILDGAIVVKRLIGNVRVPLDGIRELRAATTDDFRGCIRLFGSGGLFGNYGIYRTSRLGKSTWYVTNRRNAVVVVTGEKTVVISPDGVEGFLAAIRAGSPLLAPAGAFSDVAPESIRPSRSVSLAGKIGFAVGVLGISVAAFSALYAPGPPGYTLTPDALTIHDRFYPVTVNRSAVDVGRIRVVDFGADADWRPTLRTSGFANRHYQSGWFRAAEGKTIRMYHADGKRMVFLPQVGDGAAVLLETRDPEEFVEELRGEWASRS